ncbi:MAG: chromosomal replication initiator protein DnaA [Halieaceae bacterium]|jgi:chromosomal replication initiator protein|nr:chromosomal replication initiator protein DnaA [Halieaceae bacterium]
MMAEPGHTARHDEAVGGTGGDSIRAQRDWPLVAEGLKVAIGQAAHARWIAPLTFVALDNGVGRFAAPSGFVADYVERTYAEDMLAVMRAARMPVERVVVTATHTRASPAATSAAPEPEIDADDTISAPIDARFTFETFVVGKPNELAHAAARRVAEGDSVAYNPVFLHGGVGLGKTHLMHAIAWRIRELYPAKKVLYLSAEQFMYRFISALRSKDMIGFKQEFRSPDVLMVDDVQFIAGKDSTQEEFFHTFNALIDAGKQIVISADRAPGEIDGLEERIRSRLQWGLVADIHPTTYELRLGILQSKAEQAIARNPGMTIDDKVLSFLAHRISSNVRVLEGALTRLVAFSTLVGRPITLEVAHDCLADLLKQHDRKVTIDEIMRKVAEHYCLRMSDMTSQRRARAVARPRQVAMYLAKTLTPKSLPEIGRRFGGRDHTTVIHAVRKIEQLAETDAQLAEDIELLRRMLEG